MPYLRNAWYVAAYDHDVTQKPLSRTLLDTPVVLFRGESGTAMALADRCPHRLVPLSRGKVTGDHLECGYHGLRFDGGGACVLNPHGGGHIPSSANVRSFPLIERHGLIWLWPGDPSRASPDLIPGDFAVLDSPQIRFIRGYIRVKANFQLIVDNLLDLSHTFYVHPQFAATSKAPEGAVRAPPKLKVERDGTSVWSYSSMDHVPATDLNRRMGAKADWVNARAHMRWFPPALLYFDLGFTECTAEAADYRQPGTHFITPETELTSHYFFTQGRSIELNSAETDEFVRQGVTFAFAQQDEPMLEAQQASLGNTGDIMAAKPVLLKTDAAPMAARRMLEELMEKEAAPQRPR